MSNDSSNSRFDQLGNSDEYRHVLGLSGGKDSAALAIYIKEQYPHIHEKVEYFFSDTGAELKEAYEFLDKLEAYLGKEIIRLSSGRDFEHWLMQHNGLLPSPQMRWCTRTMKIKPFEDFVGQDLCVSYVGIRADEFRDGYRGDGKTNIVTAFPFIDDGLVRDDIFQILEDTVGIPEYYQWRSRSGCYFCFFQQQKEWLGLKRHHPDLFEKAVELESRVRERWDNKDGLIEVGSVGYTWNSQGTVHELVARAEAAEERDKERGIIASTSTSSRWQDVLRYDDQDEDPEDQACVICSL